MGVDAIAQAVLRRKAAATRSGDRPDPAAHPAARALRRALARAAQADCGLALAVREMTVTEGSLAELLDLPEAHALLAVIEGPGEMLGVVMLGPEVLTGLIEQQTTGGVHRSPIAPRKPTFTDAAMAAGLIDQVLAELEAGLAGTPDLAWAGGYRYASFLDDARPLGLLLEDVGYRLFRARVDLAEGARRGTVVLAMPSEPRRVAAALARGGKAGAGKEGARQGTPAAAEDWRVRLTTAVMASPASLDAVLARLRVPLSQVLRWKPGAVVVLPGATLETVALQGADGRVIAQAKLGQTRGDRALRLRGQPAPAAIPAAGLGAAPEPDPAQPAPPAAAAQTLPEPAAAGSAAPVPAAGERIRKRPAQS